MLSQFVFVLKIKIKCVGPNTEALTPCPASRPAVLLPCSWRLSGAHGALPSSVTVPLGTDRPYLEPLLEGPADIWSVNCILWRRKHHMLALPEGLGCRLTLPRRLSPYPGLPLVQDSSFGLRAVLRVSQVVPAI